MSTLEVSACPVVKANRSLATALGVMGSSPSWGSSGEAAGNKVSSLGALSQGLPVPV